MQIINECIIFFIFAIVSAATPHRATSQPIILPDLLAPESVAADRHHLYISQREEIFVHSLKDYSLVRHFGRSGEGPLEFKLMEDKPLRLFVEGPDIVVNSWNKVSFFSKPGTFKTEMRITEPNSTNYLPLRDHFVAMTSRTRDGNRQRVLALFDPSLKKRKEFFLRNEALQKNGKINILQKSFEYTVYRDFLVVAADDTFTIFIFNPDGTPRHKISLPNYKRRPFTPGDRQQYIAVVKRNSANSSLYNALKDRLQFPEFFPAIQIIHVSNDKIYAVTWNQSGQTTETLCFDLDGTFLRQISIPLGYQDPFTSCPHTIANQTLYQLIETPDGAWQLHISTL